MYWQRKIVEWLRRLLYFSTEAFVLAERNEAVVSTQYNILAL